MIERHKRFCDEYLIDCNGARAYKAVYGEAKNNKSLAVKAEKLLRNADIKEYIAERLKEIASEKIADADEVMQYLTSVMRGEQTEYLLGANGKPTEIAVSAKDRIKCAELLSKRYGLLTEKRQIEGVIPVVITDDLKD